ncbi:MAG: MFS transporter [Oscillospiraceae bacterium]|nr:MFS transporter [Oscillospiraceae bacterium]
MPEQATAQKQNPFKAFFQHWSHPKEGNDLSGSELVMLNTANLGSRALTAITGYFGFGQGAMLASMIFGLRLTHFWMNSVVTGIVGYLFTPIAPYITDNLGRFPRKTTRKLLLGGAGILGLAAICWFLPVATFDSLMPDFFKHIAINLFFVVFSNALTAVVLRLFSRRFGKYKPFKIIYGPLLILTGTLMTFIPYKTLGYNNLFLITHFMSGLVNCFMSPTAMGDMNIRVSTRPRERTRMFSVIPIISGLASSLYSILFPIIASLYGGGMRDIRIYRTLIPVYGGVSLVILLTVLKVKERVIEEPGHVPQIKFFSSVKTIFTNKYLWLLRLRGWFSFVAGGAEEIIKLMLIFGSRMEWMFGIALNLMKLPTSTPGNLLGPLFTKRWSNRRAMLTLNALTTLLTLPLVFAFRQGINGSTVVQIVLILVMLGARNLFACATTPITSSMECDTWDYHQWRTGERMEASGALFNLISTPVGFAVSAVAPFLMRQLGFLGDFDLLYNATMRTNYINLFLLLEIIGAVLSLIPYAFWDLTPDKLKKIRADLEERAKGAAAAEQSEGGDLV